jgi:uncharacterized phage protein (TIGR02218 family)
MTYAANETGTGSPAELFQFVYGPNYYRYTSGAEAVTYLGQSFVPQPLSRGPIDETQAATQRTLTVRAFRALPVADLFKVTSPTGVVTLTIFRRHLLDTDNEFRVLWMGRVLNAAWEGNEAVLSCEPDFTSVKRTGLRRHYQRACPHALYGAGCNLSALSFSVTATVYSLSGKDLTVPSLISGYAANYFAGGYIEYVDPATNATEYVSIRSSAAGVLSLAQVPRNLLTPNTIRVYFGCDHTVSTCNTKFSNLANYGGQPYIPSTNPFNGKAIF